MKKSGEGKSKRRKYIYFDQLLFLLPTIEDRETVSDVDPVDPNEDDQTKESDSEGLGDSNFEQPESPSTSRRQPAPAVSSVRRSKKAKTSYEESLLQILQNKCKNEEIDEDKTFLLSLVPAFKKLTEDQKFQVKMDFLHVLRKAQAPNYEASSTRNLTIAPMRNYTGLNNQFGQPISQTRNYTYFNTQQSLDNIQPDYSRTSSSCSYTASSISSPTNNPEVIEGNQDAVFYDLG